MIAYISCVHDSFTVNYFSYLDKERVFNSSFVYDIEKDEVLKNKFFQDELVVCFMIKNMYNFYLKGQENKWEI